MDQRRLYVIKLIFSLLILLFVLLLEDVCANRNDESQRDHSRGARRPIVLELVEDFEDEVSSDSDHSESSLEHLELLSKVSIRTDSKNEGEFETENDLDEGGLFEFGEELFVEDDNDLQPVYDYDSEEPYRTINGQEFELPHCNQEETASQLPKTSVLVSTLDGRLTSLDAMTGAVLWSRQTGGKRNEMLSSSMSKLEVTSRGEWVRLIPSLDGGIYRCDGDVVEALPVTADTLLHSSFKFNSDTIFTGGKSTEVWGIGLDSGKVVYVCTSSGCKQQRMASKPSQLLVVKRTSQTVRAVDPKSGDERWNFSVGQHELNVAGGGCDWMDRPELDSENLPSLHFVIPEGVVMGMDTSNHLIWQQKLTSPVVSAWKLINGELEQIDLFSTNSVPALTPENGLPDSHYRNQGKGDSSQAALYVGVHQKQLYIQQSGGMRHKVNTAFRVFTGGLTEEERSGNEISFPRVQWRPYLATALSRTPVVNFNERKHPLLQNFDAEEQITAVAIPQDIDYPYDNGYYLFADESNGQLNFSGPWEDPDFEDETLMDDVTSHIVRICFQIGPDIWMKVACALLLYIVLHYCVLRWFLTQMRQRMVTQALNFITLVLQHIIQNNPHILYLIQRMGIQLRQLPAPPNQQPPPYKDSKKTALTNTSSEDSSKTEAALPFTSRYQTDFKPVRCLGRGGFGVVFQVYNKLDENEYAVKRITLPAKEASAERVKREVRALAKLNHTNIVRYYNSWLESPPLDWSDEAELQWKSGDSLSIFSQEEETQDRAMKGRAMQDKAVSADESFEGVIRKLKPLPMSNCYKEFSSQNEENSLSQNNISVDFSDQENSFSQNNVSAAFSEQSHIKFEDDSIDIVFENPADFSEQSRVRFEDDSNDIVFEKSSSKNKSTVNNPEGEEDSFEIVFEHSEKSEERQWGDKNCDIDKDNYSRKEQLGALNKYQICVSETENSQSVVLKNSDHSEYSGSSNQKWNLQTSSSAYSSQQESNKNEESVMKMGHAMNAHLPEMSHSNIENHVKRRRVQSQPIVQDNITNEERPRTLSLCTTKDDVKIRDDMKPRLKTFLYIQMELCQKESLKDWLLKNHKSRHDKEVYSFFNDIVKAVEYVHDNQLMHRDLKPSNIFFSLDGEIKIGDFGLVTTITEGEQEIRTPAMTNFALISNRHTHRVGTQLYMSPEQVNNQTYDYKVDIYSLGLIFFEMLVPFSTGMERLSVMSSLRDGKFPDGFCNKYPDETDLLKLMLSTNPSNRPTTRGIRARYPLRPLQGSAVNDISPEDHFRLNRQRSHTRSHSGSSFSFTSSM